jgi:chromosome segregation protein
VDTLRKVLAEQEVYLAKEEATIKESISEWNEHHGEHESLYKNAEEGAKEHKQKLDLIKQLRNQEAELHRRIADLETQVASLTALEREFNEAWDSWVSTHRERGNLLEATCKALTLKSGGEIEAELLRGADYKKALSTLREALKGCNIRENNWESLEEFLMRGNPAEAWMKLMEELRPLAEMNKEDLSPEGDVPEISCWPITEAMRRNILERFKPPRRWLDVALTSLEDLPIFFYKSSDGNRIKFENASAGQQATALIKVLLKEAAGPLIIDQPEDDLDNATILKIAEELWVAKEKRQLIFSSHNANIVVNGDAELVIHCAYREVGDRTKGQIACEGAIDMPTIREAVQTVMEGGKKAFELRRQKYGF